MAQSIPYGARSTADQVLAGIDLTRKRIVVTGCSSGIGFETMKALVANGAHVIGLARTRDSARAACKAAGPSSTPIVCDLTELESVEAAADSILRYPVRWMPSSRMRGSRIYPPCRHATASNCSFSSITSRISPSSIASPIRFAAVPDGS